MTAEEKRKKLIGQILKFGVVGGLSFVIDFVIYTIVLKTLRWEYGYMVAGVAGFCISLIFNYFASMAFVFERKDNADKRVEFIIFCVLSVIGLGLNSLILWLCVDVLYGKVEWVARINDGIFDWMQAHGIGVIKTAAELAALFAKIVATAIVMVYNFISRKMTLEKKPETEGLEDAKQI